MNTQRLLTLCCLDGVSGREDAVRRFVLEQLEQTSTEKEIHVDAMGNVVVHLIGRQPAAKKVLFDAHMDEVGLMITHISPEGYLHADTIGGIEPDVLFGHRVRIGNQIGVIGGKAIHQTTGEERATIPSIDSLRIDIGAANKQDAEQIVSIGDVAAFDAGLIFMENQRFVGKAVDDRIGCALLLELASQQPEYDIWLSFSVQEEIGLRGAGVAASQIQPDIAVVVDATTAADVVGNDSQNEVCALEGGAVVSFADKATLYDSALYERIHALAKEHAIPIQTKTRIAGGNNAGTIQRTYTGVQTAAVSLPCRYIHSPACLGSLVDVQAMQNLLFLLAEELPQ
ncbi:MAG: M42 family peptidase [Clostridia bacterium]|nr:M42 family peptidase [Clostridia bacterium]